jgi:hypothetical protein
MSAQADEYYEVALVAMQEPRILILEKERFRRYQTEQIKFGQILFDNASCWGAEMRAACWHRWPAACSGRGRGF